MTVAELARTTDLKALGEEMHGWMRPLFPILRSITGPGLRETLAAIRETAPITIVEVKSGTQVFDWQVPNEWTLRDAWIRGPRGETILDLASSNLHVVNYSAPVRKRVTLEELRAHLHTLPDHPAWVPYRTSYYKEDWGFCMSHQQAAGLEPAEYDVCVDATLAPGSLSYGELLVPGASSDEILFSTHVCHPSLANDNLSGMAVCAFLARALQDVALRYSYRFLFVPGTIGSIAWLAANEAGTGRIRAGLVAACLGDAGTMTYKRSRRGDAEIDRVALHVLRSAGVEHQVLDFVPFGYDERQYGSPGFNLPVGSLTRTPHGRYPEYHTSADDLSFVKPEALGDSWAKYLAIVGVLEGNRAYRNLNPRCEPQLGRRGLYRALGGGDDGRALELALLWVLNLADGDHDLLATAERAGMPFPVIREAADALLSAGLLEEVTQ